MEPKAGVVRISRIGSNVDFTIDGLACFSHGGGPLRQERQARGRGTRRDTERGMTPVPPENLWTLPWRATSPFLKDIMGLP